MLKRTKHLKQAFVKNKMKKNGVQRFSEGCLLSGILKLERWSHAKK